MSRFTLTAAGFILRDDGAVIPADPANSDYAEYLAWVAAGGVATAAPPVAAPPARTWKTDVWRRCTDAEVIASDQALKAAPVKMQRLWADSTILEHESPEFSMVWDFMVAAFGQDRAAQILAPST